MLKEQSNTIILHCYKLKGLKKYKVTSYAEMYEVKNTKTEKISKKHVLASLYDIIFNTQVCFYTIIWLYYLINFLKILKFLYDVCNIILSLAFD